MPVSCLKQHLHCIIVDYITALQQEIQYHRELLCTVQLCIYIFLVSDCTLSEIHTLLLLLLLFMVLIFSAWSWLRLSGVHLPGPVSIYIFLICASLFRSVCTVSFMNSFGETRRTLLCCMKFPQKMMTCYLYVLIKWLSFLSTESN